MSTSQKLPEIVWAQDEFATRLFDALEQAGGEGRFAGGCVRDAILGRDAHDIDVATDVTPDEVIKALEAAGLKAVPTGLEHGTVTAVLDGRHIEVTTLREDIETDGRHAVVKFATDWKVDSSRRDFTINALYADRSGNIYDYQGGIQDLTDKRVRFIGDARERIHEDALRILRFYRFSAWYAILPMDADSHAACKTERALIRNLSAERVTYEIIRLLGAPSPGAVIQDMVIDQVLESVLPEPLNVGDMARTTDIENELGKVDAIRRLFALVGPDADIKSLAKARRLSNSDRDRLLKMASAPALSHGMTNTEANRIIYRAGVDVFADWVILEWARSNDEQHHTEWEQLFRTTETYTPVSFPVGGQDVIDAGVTEGKEVGKVLRELEDWWVEHDFKPSASQLMERLEEAHS